MNISKLDQLIKDSPLRKADIIAQSGISKATLDNVLKGMDVKVSTIEAIARVLGVSPAVFFDGNGEEEQTASDSPSSIVGHHISKNRINDSRILEKALNEIAEHRKLISKSQEHISQLTAAVLNLSKGDNK